MVGGQLESRWINSYERLTLSQMGAPATLFSCSDILTYSPIFITLSQMGAPATLFSCSDILTLVPNFSHSHRWALKLLKLIHFACTDEHPALELLKHSHIGHILVTSSHMRIFLLLILQAFSKMDWCILIIIIFTSIIIIIISQWVELADKTGHLSLGKQSWEANMPLS